MRGAGAWFAYLPIPSVRPTTAQRISAGIWQCFRSLNRHKESSASNLKIDGKKQRRNRGPVTESGSVGIPNHSRRRTHQVLADCGEHSSPRATSEDAKEDEVGDDGDEVSREEKEGLKDHCVFSIELIDAYPHEVGLKALKFVTNAKEVVCVQCPIRL
ncbi:hypothetical protein GW17_00044175 [Ensete ventricosum]|nr:hypothetical protein GW17_00044175 [Ensete ventricosum]